MWLATWGRAFPSGVARSMTAIATAFPTVVRAARALPRPLLLSPKTLVGILLLLPAGLFLLAFFIIPALTLFSYSVLTQHTDGSVGLPTTMAHAQHFFGSDLYIGVLLATLRM